MRLGCESRKNLMPWTRSRGSLCGERLQGMGGLAENVERGRATFEKISETAEKKVE